MGVLQFKRGNLASLPTLQEGEAYVVEDKDKVYMNINGNTRVFEAKPTALAVTAAQDFSERDLSFVDFDGSTALDECTFAGTNLTGAKNFPYEEKIEFLDALKTQNSLTTLTELVSSGIIDENTKWLDGSCLFYDLIEVAGAILNEDPIDFSALTIMKNGVVFDCTVGISNQSWSFINDYFHKVYDKYKPSCLGLMTTWDKLTFANQGITAVNDNYIYIDFADATKTKYDIAAADEESYYLDVLLKFYYK